MGITVSIITGHNLATKIVSQPFRNNEKIIIYERYNYSQLHKRIFEELFILILGVIISKKVFIIRIEREINEKLIYEGNPEMHASCLC